MSTATATPETSTLSLHDALPISEAALVVGDEVGGGGEDMAGRAVIALEPDHLGAREVVLEAQDVVDLGAAPAVDRLRSEEHTSELQSRGHLVCRLLLEKKKKKKT